MLVSGNFLHGDILPFVLSSLFFNFGLLLCLHLFTLFYSVKLHKVIA